MSQRDGDHAPNAGHQSQRGRPFGSSLRHVPHASRVAPIEPLFQEKSLWALRRRTNPDPVKSERKPERLYTIRQARPPVSFRPLHFFHDVKDGSSDGRSKRRNNALIPNITKQALRYVPTPTQS